MPNKRLPGLQKSSKIGFTYPQRSASRTHGQGRQSESKKNKKYDKIN